MDTIFLTHDTAWWYWQNAKQGATTLAVAPTRNDLSRAADSCAQVRAAIQETSLQGMPVTVAVKRRGRHDGANVHFRFVGMNLPEDAFVQLKRGIYVASPELSFLQAAADLPLAQAIRYGYALCGTFVLDPKSEYGLTERAPLTTLQKLERFIDQCGGMRGTKNARVALRFIREGSASPRESEVCILLTLPLSRGGYGIPFPLLNYEFPVPRHLRKLVGRGTLRVDYFWPPAQLTCEYDSDVAHASAEDRCDDETKRLALTNMGYNIFGFTRLQVDRLALMDATVIELRKRLGIPQPARLPKSYEAKKRALRRNLGIPC